jgi:hypothetical protein
MRKPRRHPQLAVVIGAQVHAMPQPKRGRRLAQIHHHIKYFALHHADQLALRMLDLIVQATQNALGRLAVLVLHKAHVQACRPSKVTGIEAFIKKAPGITKDLGLQDQDFRDGGGRNGVGYWIWRQKRTRFGFYLSKLKRYCP